MKFKGMGGIKKALAGLALVCAPVFGYEFLREQDKTPIKWNKEVVEYLFDENASREYKDAFVRAANTWSKAVDGKVKFVEHDSTKARAADVYLAVEPLDDKTNARADYYTDAKGNMLLSIVKFNSNKKFSSSLEYDEQGVLNIEEVMTHELGHTMGLKHSDSSKVTCPIRKFFDMLTMVATAGHQLKGTMKTLHLDDIAGVRALYGLSAPESKTIPFKIELASGKRRKDIN